MNTNLVPYTMYPLADQETIAEQLAVVRLGAVRPWAAESVLKRRIEAQETADRLAALRVVSNHQTTMVCAWLHNRQAGEKQMDVETVGVAGAPGGWFSCGSHERVRMFTRVTIK